MLLTSIGGIFLVSRLAADAFSATYYVERSIGNDSRTPAQAASESTPWRSVARCADSGLKPGDVCSVKNGTYTEDLHIKVSGVAGSPITFRNYPGHRPLLDFGDLSAPPWTTTFKRIVIGLSGQTPARYVTIEGFEIYRGYDGVKCNQYCDHIILRDLVIHHSRFQGILGNFPHSTFDRLVIHSNGQGVGDHGMYVQGRGLTITNSLVYNNSGRGLQLAAYEYNPGLDPSTDYSGFWDGYVANNTIAWNGSSGITLWNAGNGSGVLSAGASRGFVTGNVFENNIFYENGQLNGRNNGIDWLDTGPAGSVVRNTQCWATAPRGGVCLTHVTSGVGNNGGEGSVFTSVGTLLADPKFELAPATPVTSPNFRLKLGSPSINTGLNATTAMTGRFAGATLDLAKAARPSSGSWERGAYEFGSATSIANVAPARVRGLRWR